VGARRHFAQFGFDEGRFGSEEAPVTIWTQAGKCLHKTDAGLRVQKCDIHSNPSQLFAVDSSGAAPGAGAGIEWRPGMPMVADGEQVVVAKQAPKADGTAELFDVVEQQVHWTTGGEEHKIHTSQMIQSRREGDKRCWEAAGKAGEEVKLAACDPTNQAQHFVLSTARQASCSQQRLRARPILHFGLCGGNLGGVGGAMNQWYCVTTALALAHKIGADVLLPDALRRDSFGKKVEEVQWARYPLEQVGRHGLS
jgi:hypothetical protein